MKKENVFVNDEYEKEKQQMRSDQSAPPKKKKFSVALIIFFIIALILTFGAFESRRYASGFFGIVMAALFMVSLLMGAGIIDEPKNSIKKLLTLLAFVMIIPCFYFNSASSISAEKITWSSVVMGDKIPEPKSNKGSLSYNTDTALVASIVKTPNDDYNSYVSQCEQAGYIVESEKTNGSYRAYNSDGYRLSVLQTGDDTMTISLDAPVKMSEIAFPSNSLCNTLPKPESNLGHVITDSSKEFAVFISETTKDKYNIYVEKCISEGYNVDYSKNEKLYTARNSEGHALAVEYIGNNIIKISIKDNADKSSNANSESQKNTASDVNSTNNDTTDSNSSSSVSLVTPEFKSMMDSYEEFFNKYVEITKKYKASPGDASLLKEYSEYMTKYADYMQKLNDVDSDELSVADLAYYTEVNGRIMAKLAEVAQ